MVTRDDVLAELRLAPLWRRRKAPGLGMGRGTAPGLATDVPEARLAGVPRAASPSGFTVIAAESAVLDTSTLPAAHERGPAIAEVSRDVTRAAMHMRGDGELRRERIAVLHWDRFADDVAACEACSLCRTRNKTVPGVGDTRARWLFVGEAPGGEEDAKGEPFVGQAGRLLDNMLAAIGLDRRRDVYIANVLKCRPPGNRTPEPIEIEACRPYLDRQLELIRPKLIVALGRSAANTLLGNDATIGSMRGRLHRYGSVPMLVTYHPAYLLRTLQDKAKAWEDLVLARRTMARLAREGAESRATGID
jgi:DNA polymerase